MKKKPSIESTYHFMELAHLLPIIRVLKSLYRNEQIRSITRGKDVYYIALKDRILKFKLIDNKPVYFV